MLRCEPTLIEKSYSQFELKVAIHLHESGILSNRGSYATVNKLTSRVHTPVKLLELVVHEEINLCFNSYDKIKCHIFLNYYIGFVRLGSQRRELSRNRV